MRLAFGLALLSAGLAAAAYFGVPLAAEQLGPLIPPPFEARIGARYYDSLTKIFPACTLDDRATQALKSLTSRLLGATPVPFAVSVTIVPMKIENAFALPGGHVVVTRELIADMQTPDEFAGVLAHELGHVIERHAMIAVVQDTGMSILLQFLTGGSSGSGEWVVSSAGTLASLSYSRRLEARADARGFAMLKAAEISPAGFANLFERLRKTEEAGFALPPLLNSHPPTPERIAEARILAMPNAKPALEAPDWAAIKGACSPRDQPPVSAPPHETSKKKKLHKSG